MSSKYIILDPKLHDIGDFAMKKIMARYNLKQPLIEKPINHDIAWRPTFLWKRTAEYLACEVSNRPFPTTIKEQFADIVASGQPIRIIVAYPKTNGLSSSEYQKDIKNAKMFGIGYIGIDDLGKGEIEYGGISLPLHLTSIDLSEYVRSLRPYITEAYEHYMLKGDPDVGLQKIGQVIESIVYNLAVQAKKSGRFTYTRFRPPRHIAQSLLIDALMQQQIIEVSILARCKSFSLDRNKVSHKPKSKAEAKKIQVKLKENFIIGTRILQELPGLIVKKGYKMKI